MIKTKEDLSYVGFNLLLFGLIFYFDVGMYRKFKGTRYYLMPGVSIEYSKVTIVNAPLFVDPRGL